MPQTQLKRIGNPTICPAAAIIRNGCILLGFRNYTPDKWKTISVWTSPGGRCDEGETVETTLRREVKEETDIDDLKIIDFIDETPGAKKGDIVPIFYATTEQDFRLMEPAKFSEWKWVPIAEYLLGAPYNKMNPASHKLISGYITAKIRRSKWPIYGVDLFK